MPETYVTKAGDSLTSIAEQAYGDGSRWSEIYEANRKAIKATTPTSSRSA